MLFYVFLFVFIFYYLFLLNVILWYVFVIFHNVFIFFILVIILALAVMSSLLVSILAATNEYGNIYHQYTPNVSIYTSTMDPSWAMVYSSDLSKLTSIGGVYPPIVDHFRRETMGFPTVFLVSGDGNHGIGLGGVGRNRWAPSLAEKSTTGNSVFLMGKNIDVIVLYMIVLIIIVIMIIEYQMSNRQN